MQRGAVSMKITLVRLAYLIAVVVVLLIGWLAFSVDLVALMGFDQMGLPPDAVGALGAFINVVNGVALVGVVAVLLYLAYRPRWWGKLLCLWPAVSWIGFAAMRHRGYARDSSLRLTVGVAGVAMLLVAVTHHLVDPTIGRDRPS